MDGTIGPLLPYLTITYRQPRRTEETKKRIFFISVCLTNAIWCRCSITKVVSVCLSVRPFVTLLSHAYTRLKISKQILHRMIELCFLTRNFVVLSLWV